ncbi:beta-lactamase/transpeptidase-like protein [Dactylonectria estremocensis]|uniref:Beta-lactamase/transpeptidase-like protein n=1 Tax=Dactylonectria estremocensis TaxID=1079267 RepID=A0A9P9EMX6_9HYPO|nr:beta-lactamase/transpeptidase-like protein [Dactylonectria estremocensis]
MLRRIVPLVGFLLLNIPHLHAHRFCPPLGPVFSQPTNVSTHPESIAVAGEISAILNEAIRDGNFNGNKFDPTQVSFSIVFSSVNDATKHTAFKYHHAASSGNLDPSSASKVTGDTIYRIGSVSKTFIVYALLIERGYSIFNDPITKYIPELQEIALQQGISSFDEVTEVAWDEVTVGSLASHMSGLGQTFSPLDVSAVLPDPASIGLPTLNKSDIVTCNGYEGQPPCTKEVLLRSIIERHPVHHTSSTPGYSNPGIILLGYVLEVVTGKTWRVAVEDAIFKPLNLTQTSYDMPTTNSSSVIPTDQQWWSTDLGDVATTGGIYASTNDVSEFLQSILKSTLLPPQETRAWLKPVAHTSDTRFSIGAPWEIRRLGLNSTSEGRTIDLYTKDGSLLDYYSKVVLIPDFGVTLAVNVAGTGSGTVIKLLSELVISKYVPVLENIARNQTFKQFGGCYTSTKTNSSIRVEVDDGPGLAITSWINNGVDVLLETIPGIWGSPLFGPPRMYPTGLRNNLNRTTSTSYRVIFELENQNDGLQIFSDGCSDWGLLDVLSYGKIGLDDVVFRTKNNGASVEIDLRGFRKTLQRKACT